MSGQKTATPVRKQSASAQAALAALTITADDRPITILLVDDDADCRMLIRDAIASSKICNEVHEVSTGEEAMEFLERRGRYADAPRPGLVYLDIEMPGINGLETLRRIRGVDWLAALVRHVWRRERRQHRLTIGHLPRPQDQAS